MVVVAQVAPAMAKKHQVYGAICDPPSSYLLYEIEDWVVIHTQECAKMCHPKKGIVDPFLF